MDDPALRLVHQLAVASSIAGFAARGAASLAGARWVSTRAARTLPHVVDSVLLLSGAAMAWSIGLSPLQAPWLLAKLVGLVLYVTLGVVALRAGRSRTTRALAFAAAMATVLWIASVALTKDPLGYFGALRPA